MTGESLHVEEATEARPLRVESSARPRTAGVTTGSIPTPVSVPPWRSRFARLLALSDLVLLAVAVFGSQLVWFGWGEAKLAILRDVRLSDLSYWWASVILIIAWAWSLTLSDSRSDRVIGTGTTEYVRVVIASFRLFGAVAIIAFLFRLDLARGYLLIAFPVGTLLLVGARVLWRRWLVHQRRRGEYSARVLLVGSDASVSHLAMELARHPDAGYRVVGACVPSGRVASSIEGTDIPIMGSVANVGAAMAAIGADTVAVTSTDELPADKVKQISWDLEAGRQHLVLAPSITDIAGPRLHTRPVSGLPLIHVETPRFSAGQRFAKRATDLIVASLAIVILSPVLAALALIIRVSSEGPVFFLQTRVGFRGTRFRMIKFRSMVVNAEALLADLESEHRDAGNEVLFKMKDDPRVTRIGRVMRKYSLDELPQLFNVVAGSMSLVGPRPPLPAEVAQYEDHVHRRFLAKPGITGLWQVSGRSSLSWEESVRLDLSYVENWTLVGDFIILAKTGKAALLPGETAF